MFAFKMATSAQWKTSWFAHQTGTLFINETNRRDVKDFQFCKQRIIDVIFLQVLNLFVDVKLN